MFAVLTQDSQLNTRLKTIRTYSNNTCKITTRYTCYMLVQYEAKASWQTQVQSLYLLNILSPHLYNKITSKFTPSYKYSACFLTISIVVFLKLFSIQHKKISIMISLYYDLSDKILAYQTLLHSSKLGSNPADILTSKYFINIRR